MIDENEVNGIAVGQEFGVSATDTLCMGRIRQCGIAVGHLVGTIDSEGPGHVGPKFTSRPKPLSENNNRDQVRQWSGRRESNSRSQLELTVFQPDC